MLGKCAIQNSWTINSKMMDYLLLNDGCLFTVRNDGIFSIKNGGLFEIKNCGTFPFKMKKY